MGARKGGEGEEEREREREKERVKSERKNRRTQEEEEGTAVVFPGAEADVLAVAVWVSGMMIWR